MNNIKLIQRIRSIEKLLGIDFSPDDIPGEKNLHQLKVGGKLDTIEKSTQVTK